MDTAKMAGASVQEDESTFTGPTFSPPVYSQRYRFALDTAARINARKVVDMGCAECKFVALIRRQPHVEELFGVDVDLQLLRRQENIIKPLTSDYLLRRERPLCIRLMQGSIAQPDMRIVNSDLLTCIEVIEHLEPDVLAKVPHSVFGVVRPTVAVFTTPNSDFNVLFPNLQGFRHPDHKFEWSREEFQSWCCDIAEKYFYSVEFSGVGLPPPGKEGLGHCSQIATFTSLGSPSERGYEQPATPYVLVAEATYPYVDTPLSREEKLCNESVYYLSSLASHKMKEGDTDEESSGESEDKGHAGDTEKGTHCKHCGGSVDLWTLHVALKEVFKYPQIQQMTSSVEDVRSALKLSTTITLDDTNTCAVFKEADRYSDTSTDSRETEGVVEQADVETVYEPLEVGGASNEETEENWE